MPFYSPEYKRSLAERILSTTGLSVDDVAQETGVGRASLFRWVKEFGPCAAGIEKRTIKPALWSMAQKLRALLETQYLRDDVLGEYLRKNGLYYSNLVEWKAEILNEVKKNKTGNTIPSTDASYLRRIRELEAELKMKDRALREATALIALKKKAESIWGVVEDEKSEDTTVPEQSNSSKKRPKKARG